MLMKVRKAYELFKRMIRFYSVSKLTGYLLKAEDIKDAVSAFALKIKRNEWLNIGGQLIPLQQFEAFRKQIYTGKITSWDDVHEFYQNQADLYEQQVLEHAWASLKEVSGIKSAPGMDWLTGVLKEGAATMKWINEGIYESRLKDYQNPFRLMVYENESEMDKVVGKLDDNGFIKMKKEETRKFSMVITKLLKRVSIKAEK